MWRKFLSVLYAFAALCWFVDVALVVFDKDFHPGVVTSAVAFFITGATVTRWAVEEWYA